MRKKRKLLINSADVHSLQLFSVKSNIFDILDLKLTDVLFDPPLHLLCGSLYRSHRHQSQQLELVRLPLLLSLQRKKSKVSGLVDAFLISGFGKY